MSNVPKTLRTLPIPRPALGVRIQYDGKDDWEIYEIDHRQELLSARNLHNRDLRLFLTYDDYQPSPTLKNLMTAVEQYDIYSCMSDDIRVMEEGREHEQMIRQMFVALTPQEKHIVAKLIKVLTHPSLEKELETR